MNPGSPVLQKNPTAMLFLGLCPAIAVAVRVIDALWMSAGLLVVLVLSSVANSLLAKAGSEGSDDALVGARGAAGVLRALIITSFLTAVFEAVLLARAPEASASLGIYAPLIAVNCLVLGQGTAGRSRLGVGAAVTEALGRGAGFAASLVLIALVREVLGAGTVTLLPVGGFRGTIEIRALVDQPVRAVGFAGGGLLCLGYLAGSVRAAAARAEAWRARGGASR
jgi:electron transport complex protein RnfE